MAASSENNAQTIFKDPVMKWLVRILGCIAILGLSVVCIKMIAGRYVNLWGLEVNKKTPDTVYKLVPPIHDTIFYTKNDTVRITKYIGDGSKSNTKRPDTSVSKSKYSISGGTFNAPTQIGDNNTQNNIGIPLRHLNDQSKQRLIQRIEDTLRVHHLSKYTPIEMRYSFGDKEGADFAIEIGNFLRTQGYRATGVFATIEFDFKLTYFEEKNILGIDVGMHGSP